MRQWTILATPATRKSMYPYFRSANANILR